jgi:hypothetical protein
LTNKKKIPVQDLFKIDEYLHNNLKEDCYWFYILIMKESLSNFKAGTMRAYHTINSFDKLN